MSKPIAMTGSVLMCDKGTAPVPLVASGSASVKICNVLAAVVTDILPGTNIFPFGTCAVTKLPCFPIPVGDWTNPFDNLCIIGNRQSLLEGATLPCLIGGTISVMSAAQAAVFAGRNLLITAGLIPTQVGEGGTSLLIYWEKLKMSQYIDSEGNPTIGVGHKLTPEEMASGRINIGGASVAYANGLTRQQALDLFRQDMRRFERAVTNRIRVPLNQNQYDALVSFSFNTGEAWLTESGLVDALDRGDYGRVPSEMMRWTKDGGGNVVQGLVNRRRAEVRLWKRKE